MSAAKTTVVASIVIVLTFVAGVLVGAVGDRVWMHRGPRHRVPEFAAQMMLNHLDRRLDLSPAQEKQIRTIITERHQRMANEIVQTNAAIERVLTPEQRVKFKNMRMRRRH